MKMPIDNQRVLVVGIDGGTSKTIDLLIECGYLRNLKKIKESGAWCNLKSTIPAS